jgi:hypothetical protein
MPNQTGLAGYCESAILRGRIDPVAARDRMQQHSRSSGRERHKSGGLDRQNDFKQSTVFTVR